MLTMSIVTILEQIMTMKGISLDDLSEKSCVSRIRVQQIFRGSPVDLTVMELQFFITALDFTKQDLELAKGALPAWLFKIFTLTHFRKLKNAASEVSRMANTFTWDNDND